ncbi:hypothetical protein BO78DRAFT_444405 [Aspergillus sclerotiicarbonarius CBS 121057]|uniref:Zn(2)-C6 fungal-type domain-containing protein n=1 Tax=Aspergillus sclerotiicarbonarius (strain CBS 121057 / IBT 28362) TaxID=1448318 RepID=A0A319EBW2_ASPSB|nr:hypothetical protein BO78DRAFT_444405 [Aspergillus sclerotiicarbonarius CBS 121057]
MPTNNRSHNFGKRSRSGCWTCRRRHQKCDERKPACWNCRLRGVECGGYGIALGDFTAYSGRKGQMVSRIRRDGPADGDPADRNGQPQINIANDVLVHPVSPSQTSESVSPGDPVTSFDCSSLAIIPDVIQTWPGEDNRVVEQDQGLSPQMAMFINELAPRTPPSDPFDQRLYSHYMDILALRLYPVKLDQNPYRVVYGTLATESRPLHKAILFASALHLSKLGQLPNFAIKPYRVAMRDSFRDALTREDESWALGATVLLSVIFDVIGTGLDSWSSKLIGCRRLLERALLKSSGQVHAGLRCVLLQYNWAVTMGRTLVKGILPAAVFEELKCIDGASSALDRVVEDIQMASHQSHWWDNLPDYRMHLFLREATEYSITVDRLKATPNSMDELLELMPHVTELINKIRNWQSDVSAVDPEYMNSIQHFNEIWRQGMLCYAYSDIYGLASSHCYIQSCVEASLEPFRKLTWFQACLFPVFMIAVHCQTDEARACFEAGLTRMHTSLAFQGPLSVTLTLKRVWEYLDNDETGKARWRDIITNLGMELNILL